MVIESHIAEILDTPEIVKSVEPGDTGDTQGGAQAAQGGGGEEGQQGEAPWSGVTVNRCGAEELHFK